MDGSAMYVSNIPDCDIEVKNALIGKYGGAEWVAIQRTLPSNPSWQSVTYGNGKYVAVAYNSNAAAYSTDGITWTAATLPSSTNWVSVTYGNGKFVAVANNGVAASIDINNVLIVLPSISNTYVKLKD